MKIKELYLKIPDLLKIKTDTRKLKEGDIFWAIKGNNFDGNNFAEQALEKGASLVVADSEKLKNIQNIILVHDSLKAIQELANYHRKKLGIPIIAITGTNGKTTTKELLARVLKEKYKVQATKGNFNNHLGVPLTLLSLKNETEIGIVEMGANHIGEIRDLCKITEPDYGIITNIGKAHIEGFGSLKGVIKAKSELYNYLKTKQIFYNIDNPILKIKAKDIANLSYGTSPEADIRGKLLHSSPFLKIKIEKPNNFIIESSLVGSYNFENIMAAVAIGISMNIPDKKIANAVHKYKPTNNRSQIIQLSNSQIISDAYNANPSSVAAALENIFLSDYNQLHFFLGDMFELGDYSKDEHRNIINQLLQYHNDNPQKIFRIFLAGKEFKNALSQYPKNKFNPNFHISSFDNTEILCNYLKEIRINNSQILIKGSRAMQMEKIIPILEKNTV